ncbi:MAG TPA: DUF349 domain-containing protein, partial [Vicinamibacterales bacterium]|nr:DUF349 domain-containing protein [Vicinamibacterales bacterium]
MALLDRFRAQPRQKHADPAVRLAFVTELPITERDLLAEIVREDADARVRRAAAAKLLDPRTLASVLRDDADEGVRAQALAMLRDLALESFEGAGEAEALAAVDALTDSKALAIVAKSAPSAAVAAQALSRLTDVHVLGSIARHAEHESVRRAAFGSLSDHGELLGIALNSEFRDPTVEAVERIADRDQLEQIAARARNKSAAKRARGILREMEERDAQAAAAEAAREQEEARARDAEDAARREAAREAATIVQSHEEVERARATELPRAEEVAARAREASEKARARREADEDAARRETERRGARLAELADEAARVAAIEDVRAARRQFAAIRREWSDLSAGMEIDASVAAKYTEADTAIVARESSAQDHEQRARREALTRLQQLAARAESLAAREDLTLKAGGRVLRDLRTALHAVPPLPSRQDYETVVGRLRASQAALTPKIQELRNVADWQRWANVGIQEQLCERMEALKSVEDPEAIVRQVRDLQLQWKQAADVPRPQGEVLWRRFKTAHDDVWARCEAHFAAQTEERAANLVKKEALAARAEGLADSTHWIQTAEEIKKLQAEWKTIGPVTRGQEKAIWDRFRTACDRFFQRRHADLAQRKTVWSENFAKKE